MIYPLLIHTLLFIFAFQNSNPIGTPIWVPAFIVLLMLLLFWWGMARNSIPTNSEAIEHEEDIHTPHVEVEEKTETALTSPKEQAVPTTPEDLKKIEGIGPVIEKVLHKAGILNFAQLAAESVTQLEKIVRHDAGIRVAFPETWSEQAALARDGQWKQLHVLQDELKGGRRV